MNATAISLRPIFPPSDVRDCLGLVWSELRKGFQAVRQLQEPIGEDGPDLGSVVDITGLGQQLLNHSLLDDLLYLSRIELIRRWGLPGCLDETVYDVA